MGSSAIAVETIITATCTIVTAIATIIALGISVWANIISKRQYLFSSKPIIGCYLTTYKTDSGTPYLVLVTENFGNLIARNIMITVNYPSGIDHSQFKNEAIKLGNTPFTLAPNTKLSTPICFSRNMETIVNGKIKIEAKFSYYDINNKYLKMKCPKSH